MKVTKYEQSCLVLELDGTRIAVDVGTPFTGKHDASELGKLDAVLITHEHYDHFDKEVVAKLAAETDVYVNESTSVQLNAAKKIVKDGDSLEIGSFKIKAIQLPHCLMPDGSEGPQNTGFLFNEMFFHPGDGIELEGLSVAYLALPITGPDVSMKRAYQFARQVSCEKALAIHYDAFGANIELYTKLTKVFNQPFELIAADAGQSIELV